jgi:iron complex outermembrane recepter protein
MAMRVRSWAICSSTRASRLCSMALTIGVASVVWAGDLSRVVHLDLPADSLSASLRLLAKQADLQISFPPEDVAGLRSEPLQGDYTPRDALSRLLKGTHLQAVENGADSIAVRRNVTELTPKQGPRPVERIAPPEATTRALTEDEGVEATVIVTGSLIKRTDFDTPSPVQVLTAADLVQSGYTSLSSVLRDLSANGQGSLSQSFRGAFAGGASGVALRGLTVGATLTLIDGEHMVDYPLPDDGQRTFVDVSSIPFSVVDRVEILKDGASSQYGSDAIAGVVNVILKKSFTGLQVNAEGGETSRHDGATEHVTAIGGIGDLTSEGYNAYLSLEWRHQDEIYVENRQGLWTNLNWTPFGGLNQTNGAGSPITAGVNSFTFSQTGYLINPATQVLDGSEIFLQNACSNARLLADECTYIDPRLEIQPQTGNLNVLGRFTTNLIGNWQGIVTASLFRSEAEQVFGRAVYQGVSPGTPPNIAMGPGVIPTVVNSTLFPITVPANYPGNTFGAPAPLVYNFPELGQPYTQFVSNTYRLFGDLSGPWGGWDVDAAAGVMYAATTQKISSQLDYVALQRALNNGYILGSADGAALFAPLEEVTDTNTLQVLDLRGTRALLQLPGGPLSLGGGVGYNHRYLYALEPPTVASGAQVGGDLGYVLGSQTNFAAYTELVAPVLQQLELDGAVRWDHYNSYGSSTTPKFGIKYTPVRQLIFRGSYGQGFRAPNPAEAGQAASPSGTGVFPDPVLCRTNPTTGFQQVGSFPVTCDNGLTELQVANPNLKPETSTNYTVGFIVSPVEQLKVSIDYWDIKVKRDIISASEAVNLGVSSQSALFPIVRGPSVVLAQVTSVNTVTGAYTTAPASTPVGLIVYQAFPYLNDTQTQVNGLDLDLGSHFDIGTAGRLSASLNYSHMFHYYLSSPLGVTTDLAGTHGPIGVSGDTGNPKDRAVLTLGWQRGPWNVTGTVNYTGAFNLTDPSIGLNTCAESIVESSKWSPLTGYTGPASFCEVDRFVDVNLYTEYSFSKHLTVHGTVLNLFNKPPPLDMQTYGGGGGASFDGAFHDAGAVGRFYSIGATYTF